MLHVESSLRAMGITNLECAIFPPGRSNDAIPLDVTLITISPLERNFADNAFQTNVFLVTP